MSEESEVALERWLLEQIVFGYFVDGSDLRRVFPSADGFEITGYFNPSSTRDRFVLSEQESARLPGTQPFFYGIRRFVEQHRPDLVKQLAATIAAYRLHAPPIYTRFGLDHEPQEDP